MPNKQSNSILLMKEAPNLMLRAECRYGFFIRTSYFNEYYGKYKEKSNKLQAFRQKNE